MADIKSRHYLSHFYILEFYEPHHPLLTTKFADPKHQSRRIPSNALSKKVSEEGGIRRGERSHARLRFVTNFSSLVDCVRRGPRAAAPTSLSSMRLADPSARSSMALWPPAQRPRLDEARRSLHGRHRHQSNPHAPRAAASTARSSASARSSTRISWCECCSCTPRRTVEHVAESRAQRKSAAARHQSFWIAREDRKGAVHRAAIRSEATSRRA